MKPYMSFKQREAYRLGLIIGTWPYLKLMLRQLIKLWLRLATRRFCRHRKPVLVEFAGMRYFTQKYFYCNNCGRFMGPGIGKAILRINPHEFLVIPVVPPIVIVKKGKSESNEKGTDPAELL